MLVYDYENNSMEKSILSTQSMSINTRLEPSHYAQISSDVSFNPPTQSYSFNPPTQSYRYNPPTQSYSYNPPTQAYNPPAQPSNSNHQLSGLGSDHAAMPMLDVSEATVASFFQPGFLSTEETLPQYSSICPTTTDYSNVSCKSWAGKENMNNNGWFNNNTNQMQQTYAPVPAPQLPYSPPDNNSYYPRFPYASTAPIGFAGGINSVVDNGIWNGNCLNCGMEYAATRNGCGQCVSDSLGYYNKMEPAEDKIRSRPRVQKRQSGMTQTEKICSNCKTTTTSLWRRSNTGEPVCNACGLYTKLHGVDRPVTMRKDTIQTRRRKPKKARAPSNAVKVEKTRD